jgi:hypothetical protein
MMHSILAPSSAARRMACPGSRALEAQFPSEESPAAREGEAAHWVAEQLIKYTTIQESAYLNKPAPNGEIITEEMLDGGELFARDVWQICGNDAQPHLEQRVNITNIHPDMWGTPDCWIFRPTPGGGGHLYLWDYKYGHAPVEVYENWQLICYAAGILNTLGLLGLYDSVTRVTMRIVKPRGYHRDGSIREWSVMASDLRAYFNLLEQSEAASLEDNAPHKPGSHCKHCSARYACPVLQESCFSIIDNTKHPLPQPIPAETLGPVLRDLNTAATLLDALITGLTEQAIALIKSGQRVPGYTVEETLGREYWAKPIEEVITLGKLMGYELEKPLNAITPKQAIKLGLPADLVRAYSATPRGALKLTAVDTKKINKLFNGG